MKAAIPNFPQPSRVIQVLLLVFCMISWHGWAAKLDPAPWKIIDFSGSAATNLSLYSGAPLPPSALRILTNNPGGTTFTGDLTSPPGSSPPVNLLTNLTDNKPSTFTTLGAKPVLLIDLGQSCVLDRVFLTGGVLQSNLWPDAFDNSTNPPLGLIVVFVGNAATNTNQVAEYTVPYDAGNPVETEADLRFSPATGRYVRIELQNQVTWGNKHWPGWVIASQPPPLSLALNIGELELYGFAGTNVQTNVNAVVLPTGAPAPLALAAGELSYYLGELTGVPHPIIPPQNTNQFSGTIYRIVDLASLAPNYGAMMSNIASGLMPTNVSVTTTGREVVFKSWPYRSVLWSVWEFLERQGVRWVYPDAHGDFVPAGNGVNPASVPFQFTPSTTSIYANFDCTVLHPWPDWMLQSVRQSFLYPWHNHWNLANNGYGPLGGAEIPVMTPPNVNVNSNYTDGFAGYPHNFNVVVPSRVLDQNTNWWGYSAAMNSLVPPEASGAPAFNMAHPALISWVAAKMTNVAAAQPLASTWPMDLAHFRRSFNLLPLDATSYSQDTNWSLTANGPPQANPEPWVKLYDQACSGMYYNFVNSVAKQVGSNVLVGALAYADVFVPPTTITNFANNVQVEVCLYGSPNLPMTSRANAGVKSVFDAWHSKCSRLATYDYALLHTDYGQQDPRMPVPLIAGTVDRAKYLASIGALDGGCQGNLDSIRYNPWNFYAYPRIRWNTNQTSAQIEQEFFTAYFGEIAAPMLAYYQTLENYHVTNGVSLHYGGYCYGITPGSFPLGVLSAMQGYLVTAERQATNWVTLRRLANVRACFDWVIANSGRTGVNLNDPTPYVAIPPTNGPFTVNLRNLQVFPTNGISANNALFDNNTGGWDFFAAGQVQQTFNFTQAGNYSVSVSARGVASSLGVLEPNGGQTNIWPIMNVFLGGASASFTVQSATNSTFSFTNAIPAGVWDLVVTFNNAAPAGSRDLFISSIKINKL